MKSAKEFAHWLHQRVGIAPHGVFLTRQDILTLTDRQHFTNDFIADVHFELAQFGLGFACDTRREPFYLFRIPTEHWLEYGDRYTQEPQTMHLVPAAKLKKGT